MEKTEQAHKKLYRSRSDRMIAGVCGGLGKYFDLDPLIFRIIFLLFIFGGGFGVLLYIILAIIIPNEPLQESLFDSSEPKADSAQGSVEPKDEFKEKVNEFANQIKQNAQELAKEAKERNRSGSARNIVGLFLIALGGFFLVGNLLPGFIRWDLFWPLVVIFVGLLIITKRR
jgi:phage shock protein C